MTVLNRLFNRPPTVAKNASGHLADPKANESQTDERLEAEELQRRVAAVATYAVGDELFKSAEVTRTDDAIEVAVQRAAQQRLAHQIDAGALEISQLAAVLNPQTLLSVAAFCTQAERARQMVATIGDTSVLCQLAIEGASTKIRQLAAEAIQDPVQLREFLKDVRGKDKNVYKIIREKCDALLAIDKAAAETQATIDNLCAAFERHVHQPFDALYAPSLEHLEIKWNTVAAHAAPEIQARVTTANQRCREVIAARARAHGAQAAREAAVASAEGDRQALLAELRSALSGLYLHPEQTLRGAARYDERWAALHAYKPASAVDQTAFVQLRKAIEELATQIVQHGTVMQQTERLREATSTDDLTSQVRTLTRMLEAAALLGESTPEDVNAVIDAARAVTLAWEQARKDERDAEANALRQLTGLIRKASGALQSGNTRLAAGLRRAIEEKMQAVPAVPPHLTRQLQQLDEKLSVLQDWRSFAVAPKRIELIEQMEALIGADETPPALAEQIKRLQDDWKTISKGNTDDTDAEWQRFHQAAQAAYQPCREYFAQQAKQREANLAKRAGLLERLKKFVDAQPWDTEDRSTIDWREVAKALRESRQQWRSHQPVERAANKPLQTNFDALTKDLESRLEAESNRNAKLKQALIARARGLLTVEDSRQATDAIKQLQQDWQHIGIVAREDDQKLWAEFREQCDAVFAKRQQQYRDHASSLEESKRKAVALCEEAEQVHALTGAELIEGAKKLSALPALFEAIGELPRADARGLQARFERALNKCEQAVAAQRARDKANAWNHVLEAGDRIRAYRLAVSAGAADEVREAARQSAQTFIEGIQHWPKGALQAIKGELAKSANADLAANETALRTLCIRAEILTDQPTPASDQTFRRNYQLQRLMQGMGQSKSSSVQEELDAMVFEWIATGATSDAVYAELRQRFTRCR